MTPQIYRYVYWVGGGGGGFLRILLVVQSAKEAQKASCGERLSKSVCSGESISSLPPQGLRHTEIPKSCLRRNVGRLCSRLASRSCGGLGLPSDKQLRK